VIARRNTFSAASSSRRRTRGAAPRRASTLRLKRVYEAPADVDGLRVLVDRVWPRGLSKEKARIDHWLKDAGPSTALRKWFGHDPERWREFRRRYRAELAKHPDALDALRSLIRGRRATLLYGARDEAHNQAVVLAELLEKYR
jgi:uncharacterized protein YeaO (DUF488 family)